MAPSLLSIMRRWSGCGTNSMSCSCSKLKIEASRATRCLSRSCGKLQRTVCLIESLGFLASKHASRLPPISPHAWPSSCPGCRESDILISRPSEASDVLARKFDVGQSVYLRPNLSTRNAAFGVYEIRATLPAEDGQFRYRIKSQLELHERVVKESELSKA
jgi:hypothetical protein